MGVQCPSENKTELHRFRSGEKGKHKGKNVPLSGLKSSSFRDAYSSRVANEAKAIPEWKR